MTKVNILMATYNGSKYIVEQISSIQRQTYTNWRLIIHDDGSSDGTQAILNHLAKNDPRIIIDSTIPINLGSRNAFDALLRAYSADYYFFCDQDDVWLPMKVEDSLNKIEKFDSPALVYTDLKVVNSSLDTIQESMHKAGGYSNQVTFSNLLVQNSVTGCTMVLNNQLKSWIVRTSINDALMHDWWYALIAKITGSLVYMDEATILYRQHGNNVVGASQSLLQRLFQDHPINKAIKQFKNLANQADSLLHQDIPISAGNIAALKSVKMIKSGSYFKMLRSFVHNDVRKTGWLRNTAFYFLLIFK